MTVGDVADRLQRLRKKHGLSQAQLGEMLGMRQNAYSRYEQGGAWPSAEMLLAMSKIYGVSIDYILTGAEMQVEKPEELSAQDRTLLYLFRGCGSAGKLDIISYAGEICAHEQRKT